MKKAILASLVVAGALSTAAFAYNGNGNGNCQYQNGMNMQCQKQQMQKNCNMKAQKGFQKGMKRGGGMMMLSQLNLSDEQRYQLSILRDEMKLEMKKQRGMKQRNEAVKFLSDKGFDKAGFIKYMDEKHKTMSKLKADHMEKMFKILTKEQIAKLKALN